MSRRATLSRAMHPLVVGLVLSAASASPAMAHNPPQGEPNAIEESSQVEIRQTWYGWQQILGDLASTAALAGLGAGGVYDNPGAFMIAASLGYLPVSAVVHLGHDRPGAALLSVGLRVAMPILFGMAFGFIDCQANSRCTTTFGGDKLTVGVIVGVVIATHFDAAFLARERVDVQADTPEISPAFSYDHTRGASFGIRGRF